MSHSATDFRSHLKLLHKWEKHLASVINEMQQEWDARFIANNQLPHVFDHLVTGSIDTFPIEIQRPSDGSQAQYYNGKYKKHIVKVRNQTQQSCCVLLQMLTMLLTLDCLSGASHLQPPGIAHLVLGHTPWSDA